LSDTSKKVSFVFRAKASLKKLSMERSPPHGGLLAQLGTRNDITDGELVRQSAR
jgi:hypothetical protein